MAFGLVALGWSDDIAIERPALVGGPPPPASTRKPLDGAGFPDGVLALTWDDGPDVQTVPLARYLHSQKVSATFFVVGHWADGLSEEPGVGPNVYETGYEHLQVLPELVSLGHRIGGHTESHVRLSGAASATVTLQVGNAARAIDPYLPSELRMFRAPGGMWDHDAARALDTPFFADLKGPIHWDIDGKDWEGSLYCPADQPAADCEPSPIKGRTRLRADVIARRYLSIIERERRGIVLMHDRVGDVGSHYALDIAEKLIPELSARGFVFASPILSFGTLSKRIAIPPGSTGAAQLGDIDGDGRADLCRLESGRVACGGAVSKADARGVPHASFEPLVEKFRVPERTRLMALGDVDGDHRADVCAIAGETCECALTPFVGFEDASLIAQATAFRLADVDGDGRADACFRSPKGISCAVSSGHGEFTAPRVWLDRSTLGEAGNVTELLLADLDGDRRADACWSSKGGVACALSNGHIFDRPSAWSAPGDFDDVRSVDLADLNGDGRADLCTVSSHSVACALSDGRRFKHASIWSEAFPDTLRLADINGDGRADLCAVTPRSVDCGLAP